MRATPSARRPTGGMAGGMGAGEGVVAAAVVGATVARARIGGVGLRAASWSTPRRSARPRRGRSGSRLDGREKEEEAASR